MAYLRALDDALALAAWAHRNQRRKDPFEETPYIAHPAMVAMLLQRYGFEDAVVIAGVLHDIVEDTEVSLDIIQARFGDEVARLVYDVTEHDKSLPWEERKRRYVENLTGASVGALAISLADKIHNLHALSHSITRVLSRGEPASSAFQAFKRGPVPSLRFYAEVLRVAHARRDLPDTDGFRHLLAEYSVALHAVQEHFDPEGAGESSDLNCYPAYPSGDR